jgi:tetratricopeptide (TPR) repeat protein
MMRLRVWVFAMGCALFLGGCAEAEKPQDDAKNPHFQRAHDLVNMQDFKGAISEFEKVLETNPRSAATHFELGLLCENDKIRDYGAAIYHYEKHLELKPDSDRAPQVHDRIRACKRELANGDFPLPNSQNLQKETDRLTAENIVLRQQADALQKQLMAAQLALTNALSQRAQVANVSTVANGASASSQMGQTAPARAHTYQIQQGDTISAIAARFRLKTSAVLAANPKVRPERLRVGQSINLPLE